MLEELQEKYNILEEVARGSTSVVYTAIERATGKKVAVKEFTYAKPNEDESDLNYLEQWQRFKREIDVHHGLRHENIIRAHDFIEKDSKLFLIMDYVPSRTLQSMMEEDEYIDVVDAVVIVRQIASALQYLHDKGIIHRDIKPGNILVTEDKQVKLIDFGCARKIYTQNLTTTRMLIGTISYMSPEQLVGYKDIDGRSDIFSLGCTFYQMLTKSLPFRGTDIRDTINHIFHTNPPSVSTLNSVVPFRLEVVVHQTLKKDPDHRCPTAKLLIHYLDKILQEPEIYYNQGKFYENRGDLQKSYSYFRTAIKLDDSFLPAWEAIGELFYISEDWENARDYYNYLARFDSSNHLCYSRLGDIYNGLGENPEALKMYQKAWILKPDEREYEIKMANCFYLCHRIEEAIESYYAIIDRYPDWIAPRFELGILFYKIGQKKYALQVLEETLEMDNSNEDILCCLGSLYQEYGNMEKAIETYYKLEMVNPLSRVALHNLACAYFQQKKYENARIKLYSMISLGFETAHTYILSGLIAEELGEPEKAMDSYEKAIETEPDNLEGYMYLSNAYRHNWLLNKAIEVLQQAAKVETKYSKAEIYYELAETYREKGLFNEAKKAYQECLSRSGPGRQYDMARKQLKLLMATERKHRRAFQDYEEYIN